jgi:bifunctional non-homologous end joining protein LigD
MKTKIPFRVHPMLATLVAKPFHEPNWVYEEKYDGVRIVAYKEGQQVSLITRNDMDRSASYSSVADSIRELPAETLLLDGEVITFDRKNVSRFQLLQQGSHNLSYAAFDCLYIYRFVAFNWKKLSLPPSIYCSLAAFLPMDWKPTKSPSKEVSRAW